MAAIASWCPWTNVWSNGDWQLAACQQGTAMTRYKHASHMTSLCVHMCSCKSHDITVSCVCAQPSHITLLCPVYVFSQVTWHHSICVCVQEIICQLVQTLKQPDKSSSSAITATSLHHGKYRWTAQNPQRYLSRALPHQRPALRSSTFLAIA